MEDENSLKLLKLLEKNPQLSQRELAALCEISLGKANYVLKALINKGAIKWGNFKGSDQKLKYAYILTPLGLAEKAKLTSLFLKIKMQEFDRLKEEIGTLENDLHIAKENSKQFDESPFI